MTKQKQQTGRMVRSDEDAVLTADDLDPFVTGQRRHAATMADADAILDRGRAERERKQSVHAVLPRRRALQAMAMATVGRRADDEDLDARRRSLHEHAVYRSLPLAQRRDWDGMVTEAHAQLQTGDATPVWQEIEALAAEQADELGEWAPPAAEESTPAELAALVPRW